VAFFLHFFKLIPDFSNENERKADQAARNRISKTAREACSAASRRASLPQNLALAPQNFPIFGRIMSSVAHDHLPQGLSTRSWIYRPGADLLLIIGPAFLVTLLFLLLPAGSAQAEVTPWMWLVLVAGIDVAHVYSTLWRTYLDGQERQKYGHLLYWIPLGAYLIGVVLHLVGPLLFWRVMAYLAVFHFIRQQYGFLSLYARHEARPQWERWMDAATVYAATLYPLLHWHTHLPRPFHWFVEGDFLALPYPWLSQVAGVLYAILLLGYVGKEVFLHTKGRPFNLPKHLILLGTVLSWYIGIVYLQGDLAFTATNVIAHGIPYMALVWMYGKKKHTQSPRRTWLKAVFRWQSLPIFVGVLLLLGYIEEGLWDALVWRDHVGLFPWAADLPQLMQHSELSLVVPLLAVPQVTHYVLDGFIWKLRRPDGDLRRVDA
jgi:hypothetical protein